MIRPLPTFRPRTLRPLPVARPLLLACALALPAGTAAHAQNFPQNLAQNFRLFTPEPGSEEAKKKPAAKPRQPRQAAPKQPPKEAEEKPAAKPAARQAAPKEQAKPAPKEAAKPAPKEQAKPAPKQEAKPAPKQEAKPAREEPTGSASPRKDADSGPTLIKQFDAWGVYSGMSGGRKVCFAIAQPQSSQTNPAGRPRDPAFLFISFRPSDKIMQEVSTLVGYGFKPNADAVIEIGASKYAMQTHNDGAWVKTATDQAKLIEEMRRGSDLIVKGVSAKGTTSTDRYSLKGIADAVARAAQECK